MPKATQSFDLRGRALSTPRAVKREMVRLFISAKEGSVTKAQAETAIFVLEKMLAQMEPTA